MSYYRQPEFYRSFRCMGGKCPGTCCAMWTINWKSEEVERLKNADCSPELRALIDSSFMASKDKDTMWVDLKKRERNEMSVTGRKWFVPHSERAWRGVSF